MVHQCIWIGIHFGSHCHLFSKLEINGIEAILFALIHVIKENLIPGIIISIYTILNRDYVYKRGKYRSKFSRRTNGSSVLRRLNLAQVNRVASLVKLCVSVASNSYLTPRCSSRGK